MVFHAVLLLRKGTRFVMEPGSRETAEEPTEGWVLSDTKNRIWLSGNGKPGQKGHKVAQRELLCA